MQKQLRILRHTHPHPGPLPSDGRGRIVLRRSAYPTALETARDGSGCSLSRRTGEGQGEGRFVGNTPPVRHLCLHEPLSPRSARLIQFRCVLAYLLTALVSLSGADLSGSLKEKSGSPNTNAAQRRPFPDARFILEPGDVVAFLGGADVEAEQHGGHLEALLAARNRGLEVRFRNFGWEGDTVHTQPRDGG